MWLIFELAEERVISLAHVQFKLPHFLIRACFAKDAFSVQGSGLIRSEKASQELENERYWAVLTLLLRPDRELAKQFANDILSRLELWPVGIVCSNFAFFLLNSLLALLLLSGFFAFFFYRPFVVNFWRLIIDSDLIFSLR